MYSGKGLSKRALGRKKRTNNMWDKMAINIRKVASEVCGVTKGSGGEAKDTWWWNEEVQRAMKKKK